MTRKLITSWMQLSALATGLLLMACVWRTEHKVETTHTINAHIVLDIRQVKDDVASNEDYVRGDAPTTGTEPTSMLRGRPAEYQVAALDVAGLFVSRAHAAEDEPTKVTDADEKAALEARKARFKEVQATLDKKLVGENYKGYIEPLVDKKAEPYAALKKLCDAENRDRRVVNLAVAQRAGGNASSLPQVEALTAATIREKLKPGQMFQAPKDKAAFAEFAKSEIGKQYPDAKPEQWLERKK